MWRRSPVHAQREGYLSNTRSFPTDDSHMEERRCLPVADSLSTWLSQGCRRRRGPACVIQAELADACRALHAFSQSASRLLPASPPLARISAPAPR